MLAVYPCPAACWWQRQCITAARTTPAAVYTPVSLPTAYAHPQHAPLIGITGGSSTAGGAAFPGSPSWTNVLRRNLRLMGLNATVRNAAQGATSSLATAPCIAALAGSDVHLLLWEFAMNEEAFGKGEDAFGVSAKPDLLHAHLELYLRSASLQLPRLQGIGFIYIWDIQRV